MSIFDLFAGGSGSNSSRSSRPTSTSSLSYNEGTFYQCEYCGMRKRVRSMMDLPHGGTGCRSRGRGRDGKPLDHVWRKLM